MEQNELLRQASTEIKMLRRRNELLNARLTMFDDLNRILHSTPASSGAGLMSPDLVWEIDKFLENNQNPNAVTKS